jgi:filamentous hemagglutinin
MSNKILLKRSAVANAVPSLASVSFGELALNYRDGKLYTKITDGIDDEIFELTQNQLITLSGNVTGSGISNITVSLNAEQTNITSVGNLTSLSVVGTISGSNVSLTGNLTAAGNVQGEYLIANTAVIANVQFDNITTGNITATGFANITGNVLGGNLITVGNVDATGNVAGNYFIGNGRFLSGIDTTLISNGSTEVRTYENGNVAFTINGVANVVLVTPDGITVVGNTNSGNVNATTATLSTANVTGNVNSGNVNTGFVSVTGDIEAGGNITTGNGSGGNITGANVVSANTFVASANISAAGLTVTGNITGGNIATAGLLDAGSLTVASTVTAVGNVTGGNIGTAGQVTATGNITGSNINTGGNVVASGNVNANNVNASNAITAGTTITAVGNVTGGNINTANLVNAGSIASGSTIDATGNITGGNLITAGITNTNTLSVTANANVGNLGTAGLIVATGNITGGNINTAGQVLATGNVTGGNVNAVGNVDASNLNASANVTGGNIIATANINGSNVNTNKLSTLAGDIEITTGATNGNVYLEPTGSGNVIVNNRFINGVQNPLQAQDAATKQYVDDAVSTGITIHDPVRLEANSAINGTYAQGGTTATVTDTVAGNTVVFSSAIDPQPNDQLWFANSFNGVLANTAYFVVSAPNTSAAVLSRAYNGAPVSDITSGSSLTESVRINSGQGATLTNAGANATLVIDGVTVNNGDRILIYAQANAAHNGVYDVTEAGNATTAWQLTRSSDMDTYIPDNILGLDAGDYFYVQEGDSGAGESYVMTAPVGPTIIGLDNLVFTQFSSSQVYTANTLAGLVLVGTQFNAKVDNDTTAFDGLGNIIVKASANLVTPNIGAATGTSLTVTANVSGGNLTTAGQVTATGNVTGGNITTAGLTNSGTLSVTGNANVGNLGTAGLIVATGNITGGNLITVGNATVTGNAAVGGILTDNYYYANGAPVDFEHPAGSNTQVQYNFEGDFGASSNFTFNSDTNILTVTGNVDTTVLNAGTANVTGNVNSGNVNTVKIVASGNITGANISTAGVVDTNTLTASGNANVGNLAATGLIVATGNVTGGNLITAGQVIATGNITGGNIITTGIGEIATLTVSTLANVTATTAATSNVTGALTVAGGAGIGGDLYASDMYSNGDLVLTDQSTIDGGLY